MPSARYQAAKLRVNTGMALADCGRFPEALAEYRKSDEWLQPLSAEFPGVPEYRSFLGSLYINWARVHKAMGDRSAAIEKANQALSIWTDLDYKSGAGSALLELAHCAFAAAKFADAERDYTKSIMRIEEHLAGHGHNQWTRPELIEGYAGRARTRDRLGRHADAAKDRERAVALADEEKRPSSPEASAVVLARAGMATEAIAIVEKLAKLNFCSSDQWYNFSCVYAIASSKDAVNGDAYAARAVELLRKAIEKGWTDTQQIERDTDLAQLRGREDFRKLVAGLQRRLPVPVRGIR
jgi:tetratricopeptide (TPR) repeat protein